jgi:hypothetical protein
VSNQTPSQRSQQARRAAHSSWARTPDPTARTAPARQRFLSRFEREVDPEGKLPVVERLRRADHARRAYFAKLALQSSKTRSQKRGRAR